jgi:hypothetical protein
MFRKFLDLIGGLGRQAQTGKVSQAEIPTGDRGTEIESDSTDRRRIM